MHGAVPSTAQPPIPGDALETPPHNKSRQVAFGRTLSFCAFWWAFWWVFSACPPAIGASSADPATVLLKTLNTDPNPEERMRALQALQGSGLLDSKQIARGITDTSSGIRRAVVEMSPPFLQGDAELQRKILALCNDKSEEVRLCLLKNLPLFAPALTGKALGRILTAQQRSPQGWQAAVDVLADRLPEAARSLLGNSALVPDASGKCVVLRSLGMHLASRPEWLAQTLDLLLEDTRSPLWQRTALLEGLALPVGGFPHLKQTPSALERLLLSPEPAIALRAAGLKKKLEHIHAKHR